MMSLHTSSKLGFILVNLLVATCFPQLGGKPGKIRPGIVPDEQIDPLDEVKETSQLNITSVESSYCMHLAPAGSNSCDYGETVPWYECEAAGSILLPNPARQLQVGQGGQCLDGSWGQVPLGCSVQSGGDGAAVYKISGDSGPGCIHPMYQLVCRSEVSHPKWIVIKKKFQKRN